MNFRDRPYLDSISVLGHKKQHKEKVSKIKVPFYCMFSELTDNVKRKTERKLGAVHCAEWTKNSKKQEQFPIYELVDMSKQKSLTENNVVSAMPNITELIKKYGINIGKVEIIFWED